MSRQLQLFDDLHKKSPPHAKGVKQKLYLFFFGDDIFISYSRSDAGKYAMALAMTMSEHGYLCFLDQLGTDVNSNLPESLKAKVRGSTALVLVGTGRAAASRYVREEVEIFKESRRPIHPISVDDALAKEEWPELAGLTWIPESRKSVERGEPSLETVTQLRNASRYRRRNQVLRLSLVWAEPKTRIRKPVVYFPRRDLSLEIKTSGERFGGFGDDDSIITIERRQEPVNGETSDFHIQSPAGDVRELSGYKGNVSSAALFEGNLRVVTIDGGKPRVSGTRVYANFFPLRAHRRPIHMSAFSQDGSLIVTTGMDETARVWDASNGKLLHTLPVPTHPLSNGKILPDAYKQKFASLSPERTRIVTVDEGSRIQTWDLGTGQRICPDKAQNEGGLPTGIYGIQAVSFFGGKHYVVTANYNGIIFWNALTCEPVHSYMYKEKFVGFSADGTRMLTVQSDFLPTYDRQPNDSELVDQRQVKQWNLGEINLRSPGQVQLSPQILGSVRKDLHPLAWLGSASVRLVIGSIEEPLQIWEPHRAHALTLEGSRGYATGNAAFSADGTRVAAATEKEIRVWDTGSGKSVVVLALDPDLTADPPVALSFDGSRLIVAGKDHTARVYPTRSRDFFELALRLLSRRRRVERITGIRGVREGLDRTTARGGHRKRRTQSARPKS
jgi:WD40 repeat protein